MCLPALGYLPSWFPGAWFKKVGVRIKEVLKEVQDLPMEYVKKGMVSSLFSYPCLSCL